MNWCDYFSVIEMYTHMNFVYYKTISMLTTIWLPISLESSTKFII